ncbi:hypothetical protein CAPTEDRAFT_208095, partial [Capitella teleta]
MPVNATRMNLEMKQITAVPANAFSQCLHLVELIMNNNLITYVDEDAFTGTRISIINMNSNQLTAVPDLSVIKETLINLYMKHNKITDINNVMLLTNLEILLIGENSISSMDTDLLAALPSLNTFGLYDNHVVSLDVFLTATQNKRMTIYIGGNPIVQNCTCNLKNTLQQLNKKLDFIGSCQVGTFTMSIQDLRAESMCL